MSIAVTNPYTNRKAIRDADDFFGRAREIRNLYMLTSKGQSVSLVGERRMGKSSLMRAINFPEERERFGLTDAFRIAHVDMQSLGVTCSESDFLEYAGMQLSDATDLPYDGTGRAGLKSITKAAKAAGLRLLLSIDEFDVLVGNKNISTDLFSILRSLADADELAFIIASREGSIDALAARGEVGSEFLNIFGPISVGPFEPDDARELLTVPARREGVDFTSEQIELILDLAGYHPFFLQIAAYHFFNLLSTERLSGEECQHRVRRDFLFEAKPHFEYMLPRLSTEDMEVLAAVVHKESPTDRRAVDRLLQRSILVADSTSPVGLRVFSSEFAALVFDSSPKPIPVSPSVMSRLRSARRR